MKFSDPQKGGTEHTFWDKQKGKNVCLAKEQ